MDGSACHRPAAVPGLTRRQAAGRLFGAAAAGVGAAGPPAVSGPLAFAPRGWSDLSEGDRIASGVSVRFMGTSTLLFEDGPPALLIDGFFSRPSLARFLFGRISPDGTRIAEAVRRGRVHGVDLVLTAHSHHDHAMDGAVVAAPGQALWAGSSSVSMIAQGAAFPMERFRTLAQGSVLEVGEPARFRVTAFRTPHSPTPISLEPITTPLRPPVRAGRYRGGDNFAFLIEHAEAALLVQPSANFLCGGFEGRRADVVFLGIGGLGRQSQAHFDAYWLETVQRLGARSVVLIHWDDFFVSLDAPLRPMRRLIDDVWTALGRVEAAAARDGVRVVIPDAFRPASIASLLAPAGAGPGARFTSLPCSCVD